MSDGCDVPDEFRLSRCLPRVTSYLSSIQDGLAKFLITVYMVKVFSREILLQHLCEYIVLILAV